MSCCIIFDLHSLLQPLQYITLLSWNAKLQESLYLRSLIPSLFSSVNQRSHSFWSQPYCSQMLPSTIAAASLKSLYHHTQKSNHVPQFQLSYEPHLQHLFWCQCLVWHFQRRKLPNLFWWNTCRPKSWNSISHLRQSHPSYFSGPTTEYRAIELGHPCEIVAGTELACFNEEGEWMYPPLSCQAISGLHIRNGLALVECKVKRSCRRYPYAWIIIGFPMEHVKFDIT